MSIRETVSLILSALKSVESVALNLSKDPSLSSGGLRSKLNIETWERICREKYVIVLCLETRTEEECHWCWERGKKDNLLELNEQHSIGKYF